MSKKYEVVMVRTMWGKDHDFELVLGHIRDGGRRLFDDKETADAACKEGNLMLTEEPEPWREELLKRFEVEFQVREVRRWRK